MDQRALCVGICSKRKKKEESSQALACCKGYKYIII